MRDQQLQDAADRALTLPVTTDTAVSSELPAPVADLYLGWNASADAIENKNPANLGVIGLASAATAKAAISISEALTPASIAHVAPWAYLAGLGMTNSAGDTAHDIDFATGVAKDSTNVATLENTGTITKRLDAAWAAGTGNGGLFSGAIANSTVYHCFIIQKDSDGSIDFGFDTSVTAANKPAGYSKFRRIGSVITDGTASIRNFIQDGDFFTYLSPVVDLSTTSLTTSAVDVTLTVPTGVRVRAILNVLFSHATGTVVYVKSKEATDLGASNTSAVPLSNVGMGAGTTPVLGTQITIPTNTSGIITARSHDSATTLRLATTGYMDGRGRH
jgi:hypothetical protein